MASRKVERGCTVSIFHGGVGAILNECLNSFIAVVAVRKDKSMLSLSFRPRKHKFACCSNESASYNAKGQINFLSAILRLALVLNDL